jgi:hypothetical protein
VGNSYVFSKSGTITVNGFDAPIGETGILANAEVRIFKFE